MPGPTPQDDRHYETIRDLAARMGFKYRRGARAGQLDLEAARIWIREINAQADADPEGQHPRITLYRTGLRMFRVCVEEVQAAMDTLAVSNNGGRR